MKKLCYLILFTSSILGCSCDAREGEEPEPEIWYEGITVHGFNINIDSRVMTNPEMINPYNYLKNCLDDLITFIPDNTLKTLRSKPIWIENGDGEQIIEYVQNPSSEKAGCIVINDLLSFYDQSVKNQPALLIHYLAQSYYQQHLIQYHSVIRSAYTNAVQSGIYDMVDYNNGTSIEKKTAEAVLSELKYFSELSESYLARNDYFPFDYHDMQDHDNVGFELMESVWGEREIKYYTRYRIKGFSVMVRNEDVNNALTAEALLYLETKLDEVLSLYPEKFTDFMKRRRMWLEIGSGSTTGGAAEYHPGREWLLQNGRIVDKYRCVEISNMRNFIDWSGINQPMMILHELAHMYHDQTYGFDHVKIRSVYETAHNSGKYNSVAYHRGNGEVEYNKVAYAMTNPMEYFAELTEAYFGENDFYPFNREDLYAFDPLGYEVIHDIWSPLNFRE
jgi:hypothetical protein